MAFVYADLVLETTTSTGTGALTPAGADPGYKTWAVGVGEGNTCSYSLSASNGQKETGIGLFQGGDIYRVRLVASTTGSFLDLPAGTHSIGVSLNSASIPPVKSEAGVTKVQGDFLQAEALVPSGFYTTIGNPVMVDEFGNLFLGNVPPPVDQVVDSSYSHFSIPPEGVWTHLDDLTVTSTFTADVVFALLSVTVQNPDPVDTTLDVVIKISEDPDPQGPGIFDTFSTIAIPAGFNGEVNARYTIGGIAEGDTFTAWVRTPGTGPLYMIPVGSHTLSIYHYEVGTAAALDAGTDPLNVVQLDATSRLPAVDGSQLTEMLVRSTSGATEVTGPWTTIEALQARSWGSPGQAAVLATDNGNLYRAPALPIRHSASLTSITDYELDTPDEWVNLDGLTITNNFVPEDSTAFAWVNLFCQNTGQGDVSLEICVKEVGDPPVPTDQTEFYTVPAGFDNSITDLLELSAEIEVDSQFTVWAKADDELTFTTSLVGTPHEFFMLFYQELEDAAWLGIGTTAGTVAAGDDSRLSDARTPTAHAESHAAAGTDAVTPDDIGAQPAFAIGTSLDLAAGTLNNPTMVAGFVNRTDTSLSFASNTFTLGKVNNFRVWANSTPYDFTSSQTVAIPNTTGFYFIYFDAAGVLQQSTTVWDIAGGGAPCATLYYNAADPTAYVLSDERHSYLRNPISHKQQHQSVGAYWITGLTGTFGDTNGSISITSGSYADEDIVLSFLSTLTQAKIVHRESGAWSIHTLASDIRHPLTGALSYDNNGTITQVPNNNYTAYWVYATNEYPVSIHVLVGQAFTNSTVIATGWLPDSLVLPPWLQAEGRLLYKIVYQRTGGVPLGDIYLTPVDYRTTKISGGVTLTGDFMSKSLPEGMIYVGNAAGLAAGVVMSGDATIASDGTVTIDLGTIGVQPAMPSASKAEMEAGTEEGLRAMSPLRVAEAIMAMTAVVRLHDFVSPYSYCGIAPDGTLTSDPEWTVTRIELSAEGAVIATLSASPIAWDDRLTAVYN